jgi:16S rRNA processing protein RimM
MRKLVEDIAKALVDEPEQVVVQATDEAVHAGDPRIEDAFVTIARVTKTQGRRGEVAAELFTDFPERFEERRRLYALSRRGERRELELEHFWPHKGGLVLKFRGVDDISAAEELAGAELQIPREQRAQLLPGEAYVSDLVGCVVIADGHELGPIAELDFSAGTAPLLVVRKGGKEYLIPFAEEFVEELDVAGRRVRMKLPEGLLEE